MLKVKDLFMQKFSAVCNKVLVAHTDYSNNINQFARVFVCVWFSKTTQKESTHFCVAGWLVSCWTDKSFRVFAPCSIDFSKHALMLRHIWENNFFVILAVTFQVSTSTGVISHFVNAQVVVPEAFILGSGELHVDMGSAINLVCIIEKVSVLSLLLTCLCMLAIFYAWCG